MGAPNFYSENASKTFIVELHDEWSYDDEVMNIISALEENGYDETEGYTDGRNYTGRKLATKSVDIAYGNATFTIEITAIIRSGYYDHANLDWKINIEDYYGYQFDSAHDMSEGDIIEMMQNHGYPVGLSHIHAKYFERKLEETEDKLVNELEELFARWSQVYTCVGVASNGEAFYRKVEA